MASAALEDAAAPAADPRADREVPAGWQPVAAGWVMQPTARLAGFPAGGPLRERRFLLMHGDHGLVVLDLWAPGAASPDAPGPGSLAAELRLATFLRRFDPRLPVRRLHLAEPELPALPRLLARTVAGAEPLDLPGGHAWMAAVQAMLAAAPEALPVAAPARRPVPRPRRALNWPLAIGGAAIAATALGLLLLAMLPPAAVPRPAAVAAAAAPAPVPEPAADPPLAAMAAAPPLPAARGPDPLPALLAEAVAALPVPWLGFGQVAPAAPAVPAAVVGPPPVGAPPPVTVPEPAGPLPEEEDVALAPSMPPEARQVPPEGIAMEALPAPSAPPAALSPAAPEPAPARAAPPPPAAASDGDAKLAELLLLRGNERMANGDISAARLLFRRAAAAGSVAALTALGRSYDPAVLGGLGVRGIRPDPEEAARWYRRAEERGSATP
jgi:hypothetical protein